MLMHNSLDFCAAGYLPAQDRIGVLTESADPDAQVWPPQDPTKEYVEDDPNHVLKLPSTPWTYENGSLNPSLQASNPQLRSRSKTGKQADPRGTVSAVPPYHPDYNTSRGAERRSLSPSSSRDEYSEGEEDYEYDVEMRGDVRVRRGSEGLEVKPIDREAQLRRYIGSVTGEPGRYQRYIPEPPSETESEEDEVPLAQKVEEWRATTE